MSEETSIKSTTKEYKKNLTPRDWIEIEELYATGNYTLDELSASYRVSQTWLSQQLSKRGIKKGSTSEAARERIKETLLDKQKEDAVRIIEQAKETKDDHYKYAKNLAKLLYTKVANQVANKSNVSDIRDEIRAIKDAMVALAVARQERWNILGLDKDSGLGDEKDSLLIREMTDDDLDKIQKSQQAERGDIDDITTDFIPDKE